jgi:hypothetical protein
MLRNTPLDDQSVGASGGGGQPTLVPHLPGRSGPLAARGLAVVLVRTGPAEEVAGWC